MDAAGERPSLRECRSAAAYLRLHERGAVRLQHRLCAAVTDLLLASLPCPARGAAEGGAGGGGEPQPQPPGEGASSEEILAEVLAQYGPFSQVTLGGRACSGGAWRA